MKKPIKHRNGVPFYHDKSANEFRQDPYERHDPMVIRQSMLHLADQLWDKYPFAILQEYIGKSWPNTNPKDILELGCGVGRLIGDIASEYPNSQCWGIDYSYQMLKRAKEAWVDGKGFLIDASKQGFEKELQVMGKSLTNLHFGLAKCESLPFNDNSQDLIFSSFLFDRLEHPLEGLKEMKRVLRPDGILIIITPLNFNNSRNWNRFYPEQKLKSVIENNDFIVLDWIENIAIEEPLDRRGNYISWSCLGMVLE